MTRKAGISKRFGPGLKTGSGKVPLIPNIRDFSICRTGSEGNGMTTNESKKIRYSDAELEEFKALIESKISIAKEELAILAATLNVSNTNGTDDTGVAHQTLEDGAATLERESTNQLAARQRRFIDQLELALVRIGNKTYGICRETGNLIKKERLMAVPHTTLSIAAKLKHQ